MGVVSDESDTVFKVASRVDYNDRFWTVQALLKCAKCMIKYYVGSQIEPKITSVTYFLFSYAEVKQEKHMSPQW